MVQVDQFESVDNAIGIVNHQTRIAQLERELAVFQKPLAWTGIAVLDRFLGHLLVDETRRSGLLRFVDVLPTLSDDRDLIRHLDEYINSEAGILRRLSSSAYPASLVAGLVRIALSRVSRQFIGGKDCEQAQSTILKLRRQKLRSSLDLLGEAVVTEREADHYQAAYLRLITDLAPRLAREREQPLLDRFDGYPTPRLHLSIKLTSLYSQASPANLKESVNTIAGRLRPVLSCARQNGAFVCIDMEQYEYKEIVLETFSKVLMEEDFRDWTDIGIAMQAYLRETREDIEKLVDWAGRRGAPVTVRLVRGAYWDYETIVARQHEWEIPVWTAKAETDRCYEQCLQDLFSAYPRVRLAVATHNVRSIACAMVLADDRGLQSDQFEFQMLYGMGADLQRAIAAKKHCVRVYVPFGEPIPGMAYLVRRLLENSTGQAELIGKFSGLQSSASEPLVFGLERPGLVSAGRQSPTTFHPGRCGRASDFKNEPFRRFITPQERNKFRATIEQARTRMGGLYANRIDLTSLGRPTFIESVNPATPSEIVGRVRVAAEKHVDQAVQTAREAFAGWSSLSVSQRVEIMQRAAAILRNQRDHFAALEILEAGKTWYEADANVTEAIDFLEFYSLEALSLAPPEQMNVPGEENLWAYMPLGAGVVIAPWNFPLAILAGMVSAALISGNTVIVKPSSETPIIAAEFVDLLYESGVPCSVLQLLPGPGSSIGRLLAEHKDIHFVTFTGSVEIGASLVETVSRQRSGQDHVKRITAEMGGKNAVILDSDADPDEALRGVVNSAFGYQGQKCSACSRLIIVGNQYRPFIDRLVCAARSLKIGLPEDPSVQIGPVISAAAMKRVREVIRHSRKVARLELAIDPPDDLSGYFVGPTIFSNVPRDSCLFREEIFGPVLAVLPADNLNHALVLANDSNYALTGGFYSRSPSNIERVKRDFQVGNLYINRGTTGALVGRQPFGGFRMSGFSSKAGGRNYLLQFLTQRTITEQTLRRGFAPESAVDWPS